MKPRAIVTVLLLGILVSSSAACGGDGDEAPLGKIAFQSDRDGNREVYVMDADGSNQTNLTNSPADDNRPTYSPDGRKIACMRSPHSVPYPGDYYSGTDIWVMDADGSHLTRITDDPAWEGNPSWSPDGSKIAFESVMTKGGRAEIYVMDADGSSLNCLTDNTYQDDEPAWRPQVSE